MSVDLVERLMILSFSLMMTILGLSSECFLPIPTG